MSHFLFCGILIKYIKALLYVARIRDAGQEGVSQSVHSRKQFRRFATRIKHRQSQSPASAERHGTKYLIYVR